MLYLIILVNFGFVFMLAIRKRNPWRAGLPFATNLILKPIQFSMQNLPLASTGIFTVWKANATVQQLSIMALNWGRS